EVTDVMATVKVLADPDAGNELLRLLTGGRWRIGTADLLELRKLASWLSAADRNAEQQREALGMFAEMSTSIVDALDFIDVRKGRHSRFENFSALGLQRLVEAAAVMSRLRKKA